LPRITLHDLRHGHASYLLAIGTDHNTVADRLGHASASFTLSTYGHSLPGRQRDAATAVAALIGDSG
jgi:integrase